MTETWGDRFECGAGYWPADAQCTGGGTRVAGARRWRCRGRHPCATDTPSGRAKSSSECALEQVRVGTLWWRPRLSECCWPQAGCGLGLPQRVPHSAREERGPGQLKSRDLLCASEHAGGWWLAQARALISVKRSVAAHLVIGGWSQTGGRPRGGGRCRKAPLQQQQQIRAGPKCRAPAPPGQRGMPVRAAAGDQAANRLP